MDPAKVLDLERRLNHQWRHTKDFEQWCQMEDKKTAGEKEDDTVIEWDGEESINFYFKEYDEEDEKTEVDVVVYEAPKEEEAVAICPITGQRSDSGVETVCPITGQTGAIPTINVSDKCPVTGQSGSNGEGAVCPVTGQKEENGSSGCPVNGKGESKATGVCPVTDRKEENELSGCPVSRQKGEADSTIRDQLPKV